MLYAIVRRHDEERASGYLDDVGTQIVAFMGDLSEGDRAWLDAWVAAPAAATLVAMRRG